MEDGQIIALYWQRNESAIQESQNKYGDYCSSIAYNVLHAREDAEECVNDTWLRAWNAMPPERPGRLAVFLGRITRNLAIDRYRRDRTQKNGGGQIELCLEELGECIGENRPIEDRLALREAVNRFLQGLPEKSRRVFLLRYWYVMPVAEIARRSGLSEGAVKMSLLRVREKMKTELEQEGFGL